MSNQAKGECWWGRGAGRIVVVIIIRGAGITSSTSRRSVSRCCWWLIATRGLVGGAIGRRGGIAWGTWGEYSCYCYFCCH